MRRLIIGSFPDGERKIVNPNQVLYLNTPEYMDDSSFCIILEEFGLKNAKEFLERYHDPRDLNVYTEKVPNKAFKELFNEVKDKRKVVKNVFQIAHRMVRPDRTAKQKYDAIKANKIDTRTLSKMMGRNTTSPDLAIKIADADLNPKAEILASIYKHKR